MQDGAGWVFALFISIIACTLDHIWQSLESWNVFQGDSLSRLSFKVVADLNLIIYSASPNMLFKCPQQLGIANQLTKHKENKWQKPFSKWGLQCNRYVNSRCSSAIRIQLLLYFEKCYHQHSLGFVSWIFNMTSKQKIVIKWGWLVPIMVGTK